MGSLPYVPHPRDDTKGARPLWIPPHKKSPVLNSYGYSRGYVSSRIFRQASIDGGTPLTGPEAEASLTTKL